MFHKKIILQAILLTFTSQVCAEWTDCSNTKIKWSIDLEEGERVSNLVSNPYLNGLRVFPNAGNSIKGSIKSEIFLRLDESHFGKNGSGSTSYFDFKIGSTDSKTQAESASKDNQPLGTLQTNFNIQSYELHLEQIAFGGSYLTEREDSSNLEYDIDQIKKYFADIYEEDLANLNNNETRAKYYREIYLRSLDYDAVRALYLNGSEGSKLALHLSDWTSRSEDKSVGLQGGGNVQFNFEVENISIEKSGDKVGKSGIFIYSQKGWEDHWLKRKDGDLIYEPGESVSNEIKITDAKTVSIAGNIHRAILSQGHNRISISSDELGINTQVEYQDGFKANAESNGVIVGNGEVSLNGKNRVSIDAKSTQLDHKSFADSFVIRGGAINEDSCDGCTRHWDADFTISSNQRIDIDSNWGGIYMKSDSAVLKTFENAMELSRGFGILNLN